MQGAAKAEGAWKAHKNILAADVGVLWLLPSCNFIIISNIGLEVTSGVRVHPSYSCRQSSNRDLSWKRINKQKSELIDCS